jgi:signal transduction histidine kinase
MEMDKMQLTAGGSKASLWILAVVLATTFAVEGAIMLLLPTLPSWSKSPLFQGILDPSILTLVMAPVLWWLVVKPIRHLSESRGQLLHSLFESQERERSRIARDLHDDIGQQLTAMLVGLGTIESAKDLPSARNLAHDLRKVGAAAHDEVRRIARGLRPGVLEELGLAAAIERLCEDFERVHGVAMQLDASAIADNVLSLPVETSIYRILQEALTNVAKHARARSVVVTLTRSGEIVKLSVQDDGCGTESVLSETISPDHFCLGLDSIHERARMLGGECTICSAAGEGLLVQVTIPVPK